MRSSLRLPAVALAFSISGCSPALSPRPVPSLGDTQVVSRLLSRDHPSAFRSIVSLEVTLGGKKRTGEFVEKFALGSGTFIGQAVLVWKEPESLRLEPLSPFGTPLFVFATRGKQFRAYSVDSGRYYVGRADRESLTLWLGIPIHPKLLVRILRGALPVISPENRDAVRLTWDGEAGAWRMEVPPGGGMDLRQVAWLDRETFRPHRVRVGEEGASLEVRYGDFKPVGAGRLPVWTEIADSRRDSRLRVSLMDEAGGDERPVPSSLFHLPIPPKAPVVILP